MIACGKHWGKRQLLTIVLDAAHQEKVQLFPLVTFHYL